VLSTVFLKRAAAICLPLGSKLESAIERTIW
jgi:hypothetical protein